MGKNKQGFTLLELIMVIVIIGILVTFAAPVFIKTVERSRTAEAMQLLGQLRLAQMRYYAEWAATTASFSNLDVDQPTGKFYTFTLSSVTDPTQVVASAQRNNVANPGYGSYTISISGTGNLACSGGNKCPPIHA